jgi:hypothetical protein
MLQMDDSTPAHFQKSVEAATFSIQCALVRFRDHIAFDEVLDRTTLATAILFSNILEDNRAELEKLISAKEHD